MSTQSAMINQRLLTVLDSPHEKSKVAAAGSNWIRDRLREKRFCSEIIPQETIQLQDTQVSTEHETLTVIIPVEPNSKAMTMTFRGMPEGKLISAERVATGFFTVSSEMYHKTEEELMVYQRMKQPVTKIIQDNVVNDIGEIEDRTLIVHVESAVQAMQKSANGGAVTTLNATNVAAGTVVEYSIMKGEYARSSATDDSEVHPLTRQDFVFLMQMIDSRQLRGKIFLMTQPDWDSMLAWSGDEFGDKNQTETMWNGITRENLFGMKYARTIKTDILRRGNLYHFTDPEFLGKFYRLTELKFYIDKVVRQLKWQAWENVAMCLVNVASIAKVELYSGDATSNDSDGILSAVSALDEEDLGAVNNKVSDGIYYPQLTTY